MSRKNLATNPAINTYGKKTSKKGYKKTYRKAYRRPALASTRQRMPRLSAKQELAIPIPDCTRHYLNALCNPWDTPAGVCLPADVFPLPSQKVKVIARGAFALGTGGYGYIALGPSAGSDTNGISFSTAATVMTATTVISSATNPSTAAFTKIPYTAADVETNNLAQCRIVAAGIRIRYNGTEDARQGTMVAYEEQDHTSVSGYSFSTLQNEVNSHISRPRGDGNWDSSVCWSGPTQPRELEFLNDDYPFGPVGANFPIMCIIVQGAPSGAYSYEVVQHLEYIGSKVPGKTASHTDPTTYAKALVASKEIAAVKPLQPSDSPSLWSRFVNGVKEALPTLIGAGQMVAGVVARNPALIASGASSMVGSSTQSRVGYTQRQLSIMA